MVLRILTRIWVGLIILGLFVDIVFISIPQFRPMAPVFMVAAILKFLGLISLYLNSSKNVK